MKIKVFQANVNRSKPSLDLLIHQAKEFGTGLLLILEPNYVPDSANWFASQNNGAAIFVDTNLVRMSRLVIRASRFVAIRCGKYMIISELRASVNKDPWGLPYMLVLEKLKPASLGLTELLEPEVLTELLKTLFLKNDSPNPIEDWSEFAWSNEWAISLPETIRAIRKVAASWTKAPGPDGFRMGSVLVPVLWNLAFDSVLEIAMEEEKCDILCYADDTLIVVTRKDPKITYLKASILVNRYIARGFGGRLGRAGAIKGEGEGEEVKEE
ncbi:type-1 retrotransposable element r1dm, partial [Lasius niger]